MTDKNENLAELKSLCRGNRTDRGWDRAGDTDRWVPSVHDRRRIAVAHMGLVAEINQVNGIPGPVAMQVLAMHSLETDEDCKAMVVNFGEWMKATRR